MARPLKDDYDENVDDVDGNDGNDGDDDGNDADDKRNLGSTSKVSTGQSQGVVEAMAQRVKITNMQ